MADRRLLDNPTRAASFALAPRTRSEGAFGLRFARSGDRTHIAEANQAGCLRIRAPRVAAGDRLCAVSINTAGGLTGGDRLRQRARWDAGAEAAHTSQAAEKIYRAEAGEARIDTHIEAEAGAIAEWLPQETILFNGARLARRTTINLSEGARFLGVEALVFGRAAMNERMTSGRIMESWRITRAGRPIYSDRFQLSGNIDDTLCRRAIGASARAVAVIFCIAEGVAALLTDLREALSRARGRAAASAWNGIVVTRLLAPDSECLREDVVSALGVLRNGLAPPRAWSC